MGGREDFMSEIHHSHQAPIAKGDGWQMGKQGLDIIISRKNEPSEGRGSKKGKKALASGSLPKNRYGTTSQKRRIK